jgi:hypothetical protein
MRRRRFASMVLAGLAALVLSLGTAGAASPFQPPLTALSKQVPNTAPPGQVVSSPIFFTLGGNATGVTIEDNFLDGLTFQPLASHFVDAFLTGPVSGPINGSNQVVPTATSPTRQTIEFRLGDLPAGSYKLDYSATVPNKPGQTVRNTVNLYAQGGWKGKAEARIRIVPEP